MVNTREKEYNTSIIFIVSLFYEYSDLESVHIHVVYRFNWAEYVIRIRLAAPQEYMNAYSTCRVGRGDTHHISIAV